MRRVLIGVAGLTLLAGAAVFASDAWKDKPFESWDQKDVDKILNDSPWAKKVQFGSNGGGGTPDGAFTATGPTAHDPEQSIGGGSAAPGAGDGGGARNRNGNTGPSGDGGLGRARIYVARWASARVIREAAARDAELRGKSPEDAKKTLTAVPPAYQILLVGPDLRAFAKVDEASLQTETYLELRKTHEKLTPSKVQILKNSNGAPAAILFEFAKKSASGEPTISVEEKGADFVTMEGKNKLKFGFDLSKMAGKEGADI